MKKTYEENSLEKCIRKACDEFHISKDQLKYNILEEKNHFFRKKVVVEIDIPDDKENENSKSGVENIQIEEKQGTVKIENGKIIVKNPKEDGIPGEIAIGNDVKVIIDGHEVRGKAKVLEENNIEIFFDESKAARELNIYLSEDHMEAYANVSYKCENTYKLKDITEDKIIVLKSEIVKQISPPKYNIQELKQQLTDNNVVYGIIEENLKKCAENTCKKVLIAKGEPVLDGKDDFIEIKFKTDEDLKKLKEDKVGNVDFKSIGSKESVNKGDIIAIKHDGDEGKDGRHVTGEIKKHKPGKKIKLKAREGCILKNESTIAADISGKPCVKNNTFYVYQVHEVRSDVDLQTGNIKFLGDISIYGSVKEGMAVECGNELIVEKDIERANVNAKGNINIKGNVIAAHICAGGEDVEKFKSIQDLKELKELVSNLIVAVEEIKKYNLLGSDKKDGEIIKILIENKFRNLSRLCINVVADLNVQRDSLNEENLVTLIKSKLLGIAPINIEHYSLLYKIIESIEEKLTFFQDTLALPVDVKISYCQDSKIQSSGDVIISGKGEYISNIEANSSILFSQKKSVARGGVLRAKDEIKCRIVGSIAGVCTKLEVEKQGNIWIDEAYQNTLFLVGNREYVLDTPSKDIHAYLDSSGDIVVDKFKL